MSESRSVRICGPGWTTADQPDGSRLHVHQGPGATDLPGLVRWLRDGCRAAAPVRQGFAAVLVEVDGSVVSASSSRLETTLLWALREDRLWLAHHPRDLLSALPTMPSLDLQKIADLVVLHDDPATTFFEGVARLPVGHWSRWRPGSGVPVVSRWFRPEESEPLPISPADAPALMREAVRAAVAASLPSQGDVAATLSGGLDSSMVVATAASLLEPAGRRVHCATHRPVPGTADPAPGWEADDGPYAERMCREVPGLTWRGLANDRAVTPHQAVLAGLPHSWYPVFNPPNTVWIDQVLDWASATGSPLLLTGASGNGPFSRGRAGILRQLARDREYRALLRQVRARRDGGRTVLGALRSVVGEAAPGSKELADRVRERWARGGVAPIEPFRDIVPFRPAVISPRAARLLAWFDSDGLPTHSDWVELVLRDSSTQLASQYRHPQVWWSDPLSDPGVVELALRLPHEAWLVGGRSRGLARAAAQPLVPSYISDRTTRGAQAADALDPRTAGELLDWLSGQESTWISQVVDVERLHRLVTSEPASNNPFVEITAHRVLGLLAFVRWYVQTSGHRDAALLS